MNKTEESFLEKGPSLAECIAVIWILNVSPKPMCRKFESLLEDGGTFRKWGPVGDPL